MPIGVMGGGFRWPGTDPLIIVSLKDGSEVRIMMAVKATPPFCLVTGNKPVFDSPKLAALVNETIRAGLVARLGEGDFVKKYQAAAALFDRGDPDGRDVLVEALKPGQPTALRAGAAMRLLKGHDAQALKTADDLAGAADLSGSDGQRLIRAVADGAGVQDGVPILKKFWAVPILKKFWLEGKFPLHERTAIQGLGKIASPEAIDVLIDVWDSGPEFQMQLVYTAGRYFQQGEKDQARDWWQKNRGRPRMELLADGYVTDTQGHGHGYSCLEEMKKLDPATALRELMRRLPDANGQECQRITKGLQMLSGVPLGDDKSLWLAWWRSNAQTRPASVPTAP
ncbi:MAG: hypothetical protein NT031_12360 [Planctomycetota bacterium]|nr:hypothetical protein [Planctomycetota bacterium]